MESAVGFVVAVGWGEAGVPGVVEVRGIVSDEVEVTGGGTGEEVILDLIEVFDFSLGDRQFCELAMEGGFFEEIDLIGGAEVGGAHAEVGEVANGADLNLVFEIFEGLDQW